jgi:acyltransferase
MHFWHMLIFMHCECMGKRVKNRIEWVDTAKGLGIVLVVLGHALPGSEMPATVIWSFHMPLFFFLSGFTAKPWAPGATPALMRNLKCLVVPYVFFSLVAIASWLTAKGELFSGSVWSAQLEQMAYGVSGPMEHMRYDQPLWFFTCLFSVRLLFAGLTAILPSKPLQITGILLLALAAHAVVFPLVSSMVWNLDVAVVALVFFAGGYALQNSQAAPSPEAKPASWAIGLVALLVMAAAVAANGRVDMNSRAFGNPLWFYVGAFAGIALTVQIAKRFDRVNLLKVLGNASIVIFPVHCMFSLMPGRPASIAGWIVLKLTHSNLLAAVIVTAIYFAITKWAPGLIGQSGKAKVRVKPGVSLVRV